VSRSPPHRHRHRGAARQSRGRLGGRGHHADGARRSVRDAVPRRVLRAFLPPSVYQEKVPGWARASSWTRAASSSRTPCRAERRSIKENCDGRHFTPSCSGFTHLRPGGAQDPGRPPASRRARNSDSLVVGEWAIAIGNPFAPDRGLAALGHGRRGERARREIKAEATPSGMYKNMIQNRCGHQSGNSGGALGDGDGEVIGVNTFIFTSGGGSIGLGFAIPSTWPSVCSTKCALRPGARRLAGDDRAPVTELGGASSRLGPHRRPGESRHRMRRPR